jgi:hypothetical protein
VSHPTLGLPPRSLRGGFPDAAARLRDARAALARRALEIALDADPTLAVRHDEGALRELLADADVFAERLARCVAGNDPYWLREFADQVAPIYRRRHVAMDDGVRLIEGLRAAARGRLSAEEMAAADAGLDAAVHVFREYRRLAGDARKRNRILAAIYKGG